MAAPPPGPPQTAAPVPVAGPAPPPPTDQTGVCFRNPWFLNAVGGFLSPVNVFDYFAGSPFYDPSCSNEQLRMRGVHPLDTSQLKTMVGWEYALHEAKEPLLFVLKKQKRDGPEKVTVSTLFYVLDGSIYQAPTAHAIITSRMSRSLFNLHKAFNGFQTVLKDKTPSKRSATDPTPASAAQPEAAQIAKMDIIIRSAMQRLPPPPAHILLQAPAAPTPAPAPTPGPAPAAAAAPAAPTDAGTGGAAQPSGGAGAAGPTGAGLPGPARGGVGGGAAPAAAARGGSSGGAPPLNAGASGSPGEGALPPLQHSNSRGSRGQASGGPTKRQKRGG